MQPGGIQTGKMPDFFSLCRGRHFSDFLVRLFVFLRKEGFTYDAEGCV